MEMPVATFGRYKVHAAADIFPLLNSEEFAQLVEDVRQNGLYHPIVLTADETTIVDGRNRWLACMEAEVDPTFRALPESFTETDIINFVKSHNLRRRDLNPGQRAAMFIDLDHMRLAEEARQRQQAGLKKGDVSPVVPTSAPREKVSDEIAVSAGVAGSTVRQVLAVREESPRLFKEIKAGIVTANDAYAQVRANRPSDDNKPKAPKTAVLRTHDGVEVPYSLAASKPTFNRTNEQISWAAWSWNPVTGCLHGCRYCYAREIALRPKYKDSYPIGFKPLFHHERLGTPVDADMAISLRQAQARHSLAVMLVPRSARDRDRVHRHPANTG
jgi:hypothetical protein